jgi:hypothetical protein
MDICECSSLSIHGFSLLTTFSDHSGKELHFTEVQAAVQKYYGLDTAMSSLLTMGGVIACGHVGIDGAKFDLHDLAKHNRIEHHGSLTHGEAPPGEDFAPVVVDNAAIDRALKHSSDGGNSLSLDDFSRARVQAEGGKPLDFIHARIGRGEVALTLLTMGDGERVTTDVLRAWFAEERLPDGYAPPAEGTVSLQRVNELVDRVDVAMKQHRANCQLES